MMQEISLQGRGGQGVAVASQMLVTAFVKDGKFSTAFPLYGFERRGAPVAAFVRTDDSQIWDRSRIYAPTCVVVTDPVFVKDLTTKLEGLRPGGIVVLNTAKPIKERPHKNAAIVGFVDATNIAVEEIGRPIPNTCMLGAFAKVTGWLNLESVAESLENFFKGKALENNIKCATRGFEAARIIDFGES